MDPWGKIARSSIDEIKSLQNQKLHQFINSYVYPFSPLYKRVFDEAKVNPKHIKTVDDLKHIPFSSKLNFIDNETAKERFKDFILQPTKEKIKEYWPFQKQIPLGLTSVLRGSEYVMDQFNQEFRPVFMTFTTGTTSKPVPFLYSNYDIKNLHTYGARMLYLFNIKQTEQVVNMFPYAPHLAFWQVVYGGIASCTLILSTGGGKVMGTEGNIAALQRMKPSVILGVPSFVYHTLRVARDKGIKMEYIKNVVLGASRVTKAFKMTLAAILKDLGATDVSIFGTYGFTEARCAWAECPTSIDISSGYHLYPDKEIFEIVDPKTGEPKKDGEDGELVYTSIDSRASVVLRYRTGDFVKGGITYAPCPHCGKTVPRLSSDITRLSDVKDLHLSKIKGSLVNLNNFAACMSEVDTIEDWQVELRKKDNDPYEVDELIVYACLKKDCDQKRAEEQIKDKMIQATEVAPNSIVFVSMDDIVKRLEIETANKEKRILDNRPKD